MTDPIAIFVQKFHTQFGGANQRVDDAAELTDAAVAALTAADYEEQWAVLQSFNTSATAARAGFFQSTPLGALYDRLMQKPPTPDTQRTLALAVYAQYQHAPDAIPPYATLHEGPRSVSRLVKESPIESMMLFINVHGYRVPLLVQASQLRGLQHPELTLAPGFFVDGFYLTTARGVQVAQDGTTLESHDRGIARMAALRSFRCYYPDGGGLAVPLRIAEHPEWNAAMAAATPCGAQHAQSYFSTIGAASYLVGENGVLPPQSISDNSRVEFIIGDARFVVHQTARASIPFPAEKNISHVPFTYQGNLADLATIPQWENALATIADAVARINRTAGLPLIQEVELIASVGKIAWVMPDRPDRFHFSTAYLHTDLATMHSVALHEMSHVITDKSGVVNNPQLTIWFGDVLHGNLSYVPKTFRTHEVTPPYLQFLDGLTHGDPAANMAEFTGSFTQLLFLDRQMLFDALQQLPRATCGDFLQTTIDAAAHFRDASTLPGLTAFYEAAYQDLLQTKRAWIAENIIDASTSTNTHYDATPAGRVEEITSVQTLLGKIAAAQAQGRNTSVLFTIDDCPACPPAKEQFAAAAVVSPDQMLLINATQVPAAEYLLTTLNITRVPTRLRYAPGESAPVVE